MLVWGRLGCGVAGMVEGQSFTRLLGVRGTSPEGTR